MKTSKGKQYIVEVLEDELAHYKTLEEGESKGKSKLRQRGRLAERLALSHGFAGYSCLSYIELERAVDERVIFNELIDSILKTPSGTGVPCQCD